MNLIWDVDGTLFEPRLAVPYAVEKLSLAPGSQQAPAGLPRSSLISTLLWFTAFFALAHWKFDRTVF